MRLVFRNKDVFMSTLRDFGKGKNGIEDLDIKTFLGEELFVDAKTLEVKKAYGYARVVGQWLIDGDVQIRRDAE